MSKILIGRKGKERWYPQYAPHYLMGTDVSILDYFVLFKKEFDKDGLTILRYVKNERI
jgi:hypothetical protein